MMPDILPIIIPWRLDESCDGRGDELRLLLRSLDRNARGLGKVCIVTSDRPEWLREGDGLELLDVPNRHLHNKDANLHDKTIAALRRLKCPEFVFSADDCVLAAPCDLRELPTIYQGWTRAEFAGRHGVWARRMLATLDLLASRGTEMAWSYDCHLPQRFFSGPILEGMAGIDYATPPGLCIYTLWRGLEGVTREGVLQREASQRADDIGPGADLLAKPLLNYTDAAFRDWLRDRLYGMFPAPSRWEAAP